MIFANIRFNIFANISFVRDPEILRLKAIWISKTWPPTGSALATPSTALVMNARWACHDWTVVNLGGRGVCVRGLCVVCVFGVCMCQRGGGVCMCEGGRGRERVCVRESVCV